MESRLSAGRAPIKTKPRALFDPKVFLAKIKEGRSLADDQKKQKVFSQGDPAESVFYLQKGRIKLTVVSKQGKELSGPQNGDNRRGVLGRPVGADGHRIHDVGVFDHAPGEGGNGPGAQR